MSGDNPAKSMQIDIDKLKKISNKDDLEALAPLEDIIEIIKEEIKPLQICVKSYEEMYDVLRTLQNNWKSFQLDVYFKTESSRYIFALTHMEGKSRNELIKLNNELYEDKDKAKCWYKTTAKLIHPDQNLDNKEEAEKALIKLNELYRRIKKCFETEGE